MYFGTINNDSSILRLEKGEEVIDSLISFCISKDVKNATISGVGSIEDPILAHYSVVTKKYSEKKLSGIFEVTSLVGNVAVFESKPLVHAHVTLSDEKMNAFGGHLVKATVSATLEVFFQKLDSQLEKKFNKKIGLRLFELSNNLRSPK